MRPRFGGAPDAYSSYVPNSYPDAEFPSTRRYYYFGPSQEQRGLCSISQMMQTRPMPAVFVAAKRRPPPPTPQQMAATPPPPPPMGLKQWATHTRDTDAIMSTMTATNKATTALKMAECRAKLSSAPSSSSSADVNRERLALMNGQTQQSHLTDFLSTCVYGPGGSACSGVGSELLRDGYLFMSRRGYCQPVAIGSSSSGAGGGKDEAASGGTVRATFATLLNPLLDPTMSCPALNNLLPAELRIFRAPDQSTETFEDGNTSDRDGGAEGGEVVGQGSHKASSSSSFLFSKSTKVFRIKAVRPERMEKPVRRGATVTMGGRLVPSQGGQIGGPAASSSASAKPRGTRAKKGGDGDDEDILLSTKFGGGGGGFEDDFALADPAALGSKRGRDGGAVDGNAPVDDGGDGVESNGDADTNSLSSFSGDDDDNEDMSDGGGSGDELYL